MPDLNKLIGAMVVRYDDEDCIILRKQLRPDVVEFIVLDLLRVKYASFELLDTYASRMPEVMDHCIDKAKREIIFGPAPALHTETVS